MKVNNFKKSQNLSYASDEKGPVMRMDRKIDKPRSGILELWGKEKYIS